MEYDDDGVGYWDHTDRITDEWIADTDAGVNADLWGRADDARDAARGK